MRRLIAEGKIAACHDLSDGGLLVAAAEMALAGNTGVSIGVLDGIPAHAWLFGEDQARYLIATGDAEAVLAAAETAGVPAAEIGTSGGDAVTVDGASIALDDLRHIHESWLPGYMAGS